MQSFGWKIMGMLVSIGFSSIKFQVCAGSIKTSQQISW